MTVLFVYLSIILLFVGVSAFFGSKTSTRSGVSSLDVDMVANSFYDIEEIDSKGKTVKFDKFKGKMVFVRLMLSRFSFNRSNLLCLFLLFFPFLSKKLAFPA